MGLGKKGISIMQDAIIFCIMVSISAMVLAPALFGGKMASIYEEKENEERVNEALYTFLSSNTNDFQYILFDLEAKGFVEGIIKKFLGKESLHLSYGELVSTCLLCQIRCEGKNFNFFVKGFERNLEEEIEEFFRENLKGYKFNFTAVWQPIIGLDFGGKICVGDEIPDKGVYSSRLLIMMPPSFITSIGLQIEKIKNEIDKEKIKEYLNEIIEDFIDETLKDLFESLRENICDFIFNETVKKSGIFDNDILKLDSFLGEFIEEKFQELFEQMMEESFEKLEEKFDYARNKIVEFVKERLNDFIDEYYGEISKIVKRIDFCRAEVTLFIWR
ncbi:MAG: hypothetical protein H5T44_03165 [Thermoplasmatales archaeon]|nr:hypothetical protein [Thermoplasmatales archaeon]